MQRSASLSHSKFNQNQENREWSGVLQPWVVTTFADDFVRWNSGLGFFDLSAWATLQLGGPDAKDFFHRMTTVNFKNFQSGDVKPGAFLTGRGTVIALGYFFEVGGKLNFLCPPQSGLGAREHAEKFHFGEQLTIADKSEEQLHFAVSAEGWRRLADRDITADCKEIMHVSEVEIDGVPLQVWREDTRPLVWISVASSWAQPLLSLFYEKSLGLVGQRVFEFLRLAAAVPESGRELTEKEIILEGNFDQAVARSKGCYPGQEVVERIFTYGQVNRKLFPVEIADGELTGLPQTLFVDGSKAGEVISLESHPGDAPRAVGLAFIHKKFWTRKEPFTVEGSARVVKNLKPNVPSSDGE